MRVYRDDQKFLTFRINALLWAIVAIFVFLAGSFWVVQGVQAEKYRNLSDANAPRPVPIPAKRGLILDRNGQKILADNQPGYSLTLDRVVMRPIVKNDSAHRGKLITFLSDVLGIAPQEIEGRFEKGKLIPFARPIPLAEDLTMTEVASIQAQSLSFPELNVEPVQRRSYPYGTKCWEYDSHGRRLAEVRGARQDPVAGDNVYLTIDFELQRRAEQYFIEN